MEHHNHDEDPLTHTHNSEEPDLLSQAFETLKSGQPYTVDQVGHAGHHGKLESVRKFDYKGHNVVILTQYTITVDGQPVDAHVSVDNKGRLNTHALPNYSFNSAVGMMKALIDCLPSSFSTR